MTKQIMWEHDDRAVLERKIKRCSSCSACCQTENFTEKKKKKNLSSALETKIVCQATQNKRVA